MDEAADALEDALSRQVRALLRPVPPRPDPSKPRAAPLFRVMVSPILPKLAQSLLRLLQNVLPLPAELAHLKRVRRSQLADGSSHLEVLLARDAAWAMRPDSLTSELSRFELSPSLRDVPAAAPATVAEMRAWRLHWPLNFRRPRRPEPTLCAGELRRAAAHVVAVRALAGTAASGDAPVAAMLVDPATNAVLATAVDRSARRSAGAPVSPDRVRHAVMECIREAAKPHAARDAQGGVPDARRRSAERYLCTGVDCYVSREPCVMCAMGLLHSRIRRVFYVAPNPDEIGGLSAVAIHQEPALNHRYLGFFFPVESLVDATEADANQGTVEASDLPD